MSEYALKLGTILFNGSSKGDLSWFGETNTTGEKPPESPGSFAAATPSRHPELRIPDFSKTEPDFSVYSSDAFYSALGEGMKRDL